MLEPLADWQRDGLRSLLWFQKGMLSGLPTSAFTEAVYDHALANVEAGEARDWDLEGAVASVAGTGITSRVLHTDPFCTVSAFRPAGAVSGAPVLLVAPYSGYAPTVLRALIAGLLDQREVIVTSWRDARAVPLTAGAFDLDRQCALVLEVMTVLGPDLHVVAVSQGAVPALAASALRAAAGDGDHGPSTLALLGGPIDPTLNLPPSQIGLLKLPTAVIQSLAFVRVGSRHPGAGRLVYPSLNQLALIAGGDVGTYARVQVGAFCERVDGRRNGYVTGLEDFHAVIDTPAELVMAMITEIFRGRALIEGRFTVGGVPVRPAALGRTALVTIEAEDDQLVGATQTHAAHGICSGVEDSRRFAYTVAGAAHPDLFLGTLAETKVFPLLRETIRRFDP